MKNKVSELKQRRVALLAEARSVLENAEKESRSVTAEETQEYERITSDLDSLDATIRTQEDLDRRSRDLASESDRTEQRNVETNGYDKVFDKYLRHGMEELDSEERSVLRGGYQVEQRAGNAVESTGAAGGFLVPTDFQTQIVNRLEQTSAVRQAGATVLDTSGGNPILVPVVTAHSVPEGVVAEGAGPTADVDTFAQKSLGAFKFPALVKVSVELLQDNAVNLEAYLANELGRKIGRIAGDKYAVGAGTTEPTGVFTAADTVTAAADTTSLSTDDVLDLIYSVEPQYRQGASFVMNDAIIAQLRKIKWNIGTDPVGYAWQPSVQAGVPDKLFGYSLYSEPAAPSTVAATDKVAAFGDFSRFYIRIAGGISFVRLNERYMDSMMVGFLAWIRTDSNLMDLNAVKVLKMHA